MIQDIDFEKIVDESLGFEDADEEASDDADEIQSEKPFDADKIRIEQQMLSVKYVYELYETKILETNPNFQRKSVWKENKRKSLLIESLMLRIPIPAFYFYEDEMSCFQVIDGQQRLITIFEFLQDKFKLSGLEYLESTCNKKKFSELEERYKQRIYRTQLAVNILDARSPYRVIYDIFRRINTGGIPLTPQEMRNAICKQVAREFLQMGVNSKYYLEATRRKINDIRMDSQEMYLRFVAFYQRYNYQKSRLGPFYYSKLVSLLDEEIENIPLLTQEQRQEIFEAFERSMKKCKELFGDYAFVKIYVNKETGKIDFKKDLINKSLFTAFSVILANPVYANMDLSRFHQKALSVLAEALESSIYDNAISGATGDRRNIISYFNFSQEVINKCVPVRRLKQ